MLTLALLPPINDWVYIVVYTIYAITILGTIVIIITENRNPVKVWHGYSYWHFFPS